MLLLCVWCHTVLAQPAPSAFFPLPDALRPNVAFWKRTFAVLDTNGGMLHDTEDISIVYHIWYNDLPTDPPLRQGMIDEMRSRYRAILDTLADGKRLDLTGDEARVLAMFQGKDHAMAFRAAANNMRFQGGMRSRFAQSLVRSWAYLPEMERIFAEAGLPTELTLLPHIESSFENRALSKVGAAGIWQIMPATGRRYLRISGGVDERLDVYAATAAAAQILRENYDMLGTWELAITAYNHGPYGMKQAVATVGTTDFGVILQRYRGPLFGFASQNFYAEFLAAVDLVKNYKHYFGDILFEAPPRPVTVEARAVREPAPVVASVPQFASAPRPGAPAPTTYASPSPATTSLPAARPSPVEQRTPAPASLAAIPPPPPVMLQAPVEQRPLKQASVPPTSPPAAVTPPAQVEQRMPELANVAAISTPTSVTLPTPVTLPAPVEQRTLKQASGPTSSPPASATPPSRGKEYRVRSGDSLATIAQRHGTTVETLASLNGLRQRAGVRAGQTLMLPAPAQPVVNAETVLPKGVVLPVVATLQTTSGLPIQRTVLSTITRATAPIPPTSSGNAAQGMRLPEIDDRFQIKGETIRIAAQEQLNQYAGWLDVPVQRLLSLNRLSARQSPSLGTAVRLDFSKVSAGQFTQRRLQYHRGLEQEFLRRHRIGDVVTRKLKPGETLLSVSRQEPGVPLWLLQRYNSHLELNASRPGTELRIPKVVSRVS